MAHLTIRWTSRALLRLDHSAAHIQKDSPQAAARVVSRIVTAVDLLAEQPGLATAQAREIRGLLDDLTEMRDRLRRLAR